MYISCATAIEKKNETEIKIDLICDDENDESLLKSTCVRNNRAALSASSVR